MHLERLLPSLCRFLLSRGSPDTSWVHPDFFIMADHRLINDLTHLLFHFLDLSVEKLVNTQAKVP